MRASLHRIALPLDVSCAVARHASYMNINRAPAVVFTNVLGRRKATRTLRAFPVGGRDSGRSFSAMEAKGEGKLATPSSCREAAARGTFNSPEKLTAARMLATTHAGHRSKDANSGIADLEAQELAKGSCKIVTSMPPPSTPMTSDQSSSDPMGDLRARTDEATR